MSAMKKLNYLQIPVLAIAVIFFGAALLRAATTYRITAGSSPQVTEHSTCKKVTNSTGNDVFIPTRTVAEWNSFINNPPSGVTVASCTCNLPWGGTIGEGQSVTAYSSSYIACNQSCSSYAQTRTCSNGVLSGSYTNSSCSVWPTTNASWTGSWGWSGYMGPGGGGMGYQRIEGNWWPPDDPWRGFVLFDTGTIPDSAVILSSSITMFKSTGNGDFYKVNDTLPWPLPTWAYDVAVTYLGGTPGCAWCWATWSVPTDSIKKDRNTAYSIRQPNQDAYVRYLNETEGYPPRLDVSYCAP